MKAYELTEASFLEDVATHEMQLLRDDGDGPLMECKHTDIQRVSLYARAGALATPEAKP